MNGTVVGGYEYVKGIRRIMLIFKRLEWSNAFHMVKIIIDFTEDRLTQLVGKMDTVKSSHSFNSRRGFVNKKL